MSRPATKLIDLDALRHNVTRVRELAPNSAVMPVIKANAYGHGIVSVARALQGIDGVAVACLEEAMILRDAGCRDRILLLEGFFEAAELATVEALDLDIVLHHREQIECLLNTELKKPLNVWLKINTGMHRLGVEPGEVKPLWTKLANCAWVAKTPKLMTHFADAAHTDRDTTTKQMETFFEVTSDLPGERTLANSAGIIAWPKSHADWVRPGLMLYGVSPFKDKVGRDLGLHPVMHLRSALISIRTCQAGERIGYGGLYTCPDEKLIGVVAIGYGDGYPLLGVQTDLPVYINGKHVPVVGQVSMDMLCVDLTGIDNPQIGDIVTLWGPNLPVETIAQATGRSPYDLLCGIAQRVGIASEV